MKSKLYFLIPSAFLVSCGGGSGGSLAVAPPIVTLPVDAVMGGLWVGEMTFDMAAGSETSVALLTDDGRFRLLTDTTFTQLVGDQQIDINDVVGSGSGFVANGGVWPDGTTVTAVSIDATLTERNTFRGNWTTTSGESGTFEYFYDTEYERASSLPVLKGVWSVYDDIGSVTATFTIEDTGFFTGQNTFGCISSGQISIIDSSYNLYEVDSTISNCPIAGDYTGLATIGEINVPNDAILLAISNDMRGFVLGLEK